MVGFGEGFLNIYINSCPFSFYIAKIISLHLPFDIASMLYFDMCIILFNILTSYFLKKINKLLA